MYCVTPAGIQVCNDVGDDIKCNNKVVVDSFGCDKSFIAVVVVVVLDMDGVHTNRKMYSVIGGDCGEVVVSNNGTMEDTGT